MEPECRNIYKNGRRGAGFTQEAAAERLGICVESVRAYETGRSIPPNEVVERMCVVYNNMILAFDHIQATNAMMARVLPKLEQRSVLEVAVRIYNRLNRFQQGRGVDRLMAIAEDGRIDEEERGEFDAIMADLREIVRSGLELEVFCGGDLNAK